jgi:hypothetical protein
MILLNILFLKILKYWYVVQLVSLHASSMKIPGWHNNRYSTRLFSFPVNDGTLSVHFDIGIYDILLVDEMSMIPANIFRHIINTISQLPVRPLVIITGDAAQQNSTLGNICYSYCLIQQFRCTCPMLQRIVDHLRFWQPGPTLLQLLNSKCLLNVLSDENNIWPILVHHSDAVVITRKASSMIN